MEDTGKDERKKMRPIAGNTSKEISQYYRSKNEECNVVKHYPDWDAVRGEPILDLMRVGREMLSVDAELEAKRLEYDNRRQLFDQQWKDLRRKEIALKKSFVKFDEFVRENREKRERADRKIREEKERQKIRESEICDLEIKLKQLEKVRDRMKSFVEEYKPFQAYLEELLNSNEFQSIAEIFNRYETLMAARISLNINQDKTLESLELTNLQLQKLTEKRAQHLLDLNSRLAKAQARYELAHAESLKWEVAVAENKDIVTQQELENTQIRDCVWNLYNQMCYRKGVSAEAKREDLEEQLQMVKRTIVELGKIVKMAQRRARRELRAIQKSEYQKKVKKVIRARSYMSRMSALSTVSRSRTKSVRSIASTWDTRSMISTF